MNIKESYIEYLYLNFNLNHIFRKIVIIREFSLLIVIKNI